MLARRPRSADAELSPYFHASLGAPRTVSGFMVSYMPVLIHQFIIRLLSVVVPVSIPWFGQSVDGARPATLRQNLPVGKKRLPSNHLLDILTAP